MPFKRLSVGDTFDFINDAAPRSNSFFERCTKISARRYRTASGMRSVVGTTSVVVYHVEKPAPLSAEDIAARKRDIPTPRN